MGTGAMQLQDHYQMAVIREFEETALTKANEGVLHGSLHLSVGMEAIPVGVFKHFRQGDWFASTHRAHGHAIAAGVPLVRMFAELFGRDTSLCGGKAGSMHMADIEHGFMGGTGIVGASIHLAAGAALTLKQKGPENVAIAFFGDGAANRGTFHEGLNLASLWRLPVVFICENNAFGQWTRHEDASAVETVAERSIAYGIPGVRVNGNDVGEISSAAESAILRARQGGGPSLLEFQTYRLRDHSGGADQRTYREREEIQTMRRLEPLAVSREQLMASGQATDEEITTAESEARQSVLRASEEAEALPRLDAILAFNDVTSS